MDQTTHELRLSNWKAIIDSCQVRPNGQTARHGLQKTMCLESSITTGSTPCEIRRVKNRTFRY